MTFISRTKRPPGKLPADAIRKKPRSRGSLPRACMSFVSCVSYFYVIANEDPQTYYEARGRKVQGRRFSLRKTIVFCQASAVSCGA